MELSRTTSNRKSISASWDKTLNKPKLHVSQWVRLLQDKRTFQRGYNESLTDKIYQITDVNSTIQPVTYKVQDINKDPIIGVFYYNQLSPIQFPTEFHIDPTGKQRQLTSADKVKFKQILLKEYYQPIWVPDAVLSKRSQAEKINKTINSAETMKWLLE